MINNRKMLAPADNREEEEEKKTKLHSKMAYPFSEETIKLKK
jgi:hypothetical protein